MKCFFKEKIQRLARLPKILPRYHKQKKRPHGYLSEQYLRTKNIEKTEKTDPASTYNKIFKLIINSKP